MLSKHLPHSPFFPFSTLVKLRWLGLLGQVIVVVFLKNIGFLFPFGKIMQILTVSFFVNLFFHYSKIGQFELSEQTLPSFLVYDVAQFTSVLYLMGGIVNPFVVFILGPLLISASFPEKHTLFLTLFVGTCAIAILYFSPYPLPWFKHELIFRSFFRLAFALAIWSSLVFYSLYVFHVHSMKQYLSENMYEVKDEYLKQKHFTELGLLAAACAHELGTPIGTIMLIARDIYENSEGATQNDAKLILDQASRCRHILSTLREGSENSALFSVPIKNFLHSIAAKYTTPQKELLFHGDERIDIFASGAISLAFGNLIQNALRFARQTVTISWKETPFGLMVEVNDDGPGFPPKMLENLGYAIPVKSAGQNVGVGLYIAKNLFQCFGIEVTFENRDGALCIAHVPSKLIKIRRAP